MEDATWQFLVVQGFDHLTAASYAEELQARVRVVALTTDQGNLEASLDGVDLDLKTKPAYVPGIEGGTAYYGAAPYRSVLVGSHTVNVAGADYALDLAGGSRHTLVLWGDRDDPTLTVLDDPGPGSAAHSVTAYNLSGSEALVFSKVAGA